MPVTSLIDRLSQARPAVADRTASLVDAAERQALLHAVLACEAETVVATDRPRHRRRLMTATAAAPVAVGAVVVALLWAGSPTVPVPSRPVPEVPSTRADTDTVLDRVRLAVAANDDGILHVKTDFGHDVLWEAWHDERGRRSRSTSMSRAGVPMYDHELVADGDRLTVKVVSHNDRAWWTYTTEERGGAPLDGGMSPAAIRARLAAGALHEVGRETLEGRDVLRLRWVPQEKPGVMTVPGDLWVDVERFLPIRSVTESRPGTTMRSDFEWLPRDTATASLTAPIPPGFKQLPGAPAAGRDEPGVG